MVEIYTEAFVLDKQDFKEADAIVHLYTRELGRVSARARGLRKMLSKSGPHLEPLNFVQVRLMHMKSGYYQIIDALPVEGWSLREAKRDGSRSAVLVAMAELVDVMTYELHPDPFLWDMIMRVAHADVDMARMHRVLLGAFGFDPRYAVCAVCHRGVPSGFSTEEHMFLCTGCASKAPRNGIVLI